MTGGDFGGVLVSGATGLRVDRWWRCDSSEIARTHTVALTWRRKLCYTPAYPAFELEGMCVSEVADWVESVRTI